MTGLTVLLAEPVFAYVDPGTGSYVLQLIIAGLVGFAFTLKIFWSRLRVFFQYNILKRKNPPGGPKGEDE
ncbi:MAG: hypothetical protein JXB45_11370 [Candidatus Krumholzibacteriota bacterium]|nr:hypothetical protein [Candidatus Krumholzibacteriota bacterium]